MSGQISRSCISKDILNAIMFSEKKNKNFGSFPILILEIQRIPITAKEKAYTFVSIGYCISYAPHIVWLS